jgi:RHS repeat-associated protein
MLLNHTYSPSTTYTDEYMKYNADNEICAIATKKPSTCPSPSEPGIAGDPTYDEDGDMTSDGSEAPAKFGYTVRDQLSGVTPNGESAKQVVSRGTGQDDLAAIGSEEIVTNILGVGVTGSGTSASYYSRGSEGELLAKRTAKGKPSETEYYVLDPRNSPALLTNSSGAQTAPSSGTYQYDVYGKSIGSGPSTFAYRSGMLLPDGLIHYGARYYDPMYGGWTQQDPLRQIEDLTQADRYAFAGDDPVNLADATGRAVRKRTS